MPDHVHGDDNPVKTGGGRINGHTKGENGYRRFVAIEELVVETILDQSFLEEHLLCLDDRDG